MKKLVIYDFDKTIYNGETNIDFTKYVFKNYKKYRFKIIKSSIISLFFITNLKKSKEIFFSYLNNEKIDEIKKIRDKFWESKQDKIYKYFFDEIIKNKLQSDEIILISASPTFLLEKIAKDLGFNKVIATDFKITDKFNAKIIGKNCKKEVKVDKLNEYLNNVKYEVISFYSDSISDKPLYDISINKYFIDKGILKKGLPTVKKLIDRLK